MLRSKLFQAVFTYGLLLLAAYGCFTIFSTPLTNPDFFWHLATGQIIAQTHTLPTSDVFSWTMEGAKWVNFEWLTQVLYYGVWQLGQYNAVYALKLILFFTQIFILVKILLLYKRNDLLGIMLALWLAGMTMTFDLRPDNISTIFFLLILYFLERLRLGLEKPSSAKFFVLAAVVFAVWANFHAGLFYSIGLIGSYAVGELAYRFYNPVKEGEERDFSYFYAYSFMALGAMLGALVNPYGIGVYTIAFEHWKDSALIGEFITEWQPSEITHPLKIGYWITMAITFTLALWRIFGRNNIAFHQLIGIVTFALLSATHQRNVLLFMLISIPFILSSVSEFKISDKVVKTLSLVIAVVLISYFSFFNNLRKQYWPWYHANLPGAVKFLKEHKEEFSKMNFYNMWSMGGYLDYYLYPDYKVFQDGRYIFHKFLTYGNPNSNIDAWPKVIDQYDLGLVVTNYSPAYSLESRVDASDPLSQTMRVPTYLVSMPQPDWAMVYWDKDSMIFARRDLADKEWLAKAEFKFIGPGLCEFILNAVMQNKMDLKSIEDESARYAGFINNYKNGAYETESLQVCISVIKEEMAAASAKQTAAPESALPLPAAAKAGN